MKRLSDILARVKVTRKEGPEDPGIGSICFDSRKAGSGSAFFAVKGTRTDGHEYIDDAVNAGASAIICEEFPESIRPDIAYIGVEDSATALALSASSFFDDPA